MALCSLLYDTAGKLLDIGPAGTDWGFSVMAPPAGARRFDPKTLPPHVVASRAGFKVVDNQAVNDDVTLACLQSLAVCKGGDGASKTAAELAPPLPADPVVRQRALDILIASAAKEAFADG